MKPLKKFKETLFDKQADPKTRQTLSLFLANLLFETHKNGSDPKMVDFLVRLSKKLRKSSYVLPIATALHVSNHDSLESIIKESNRLVATYPTLVLSSFNMILQSRSVEHLPQIVKTVFDLSIECDQVYLTRFIVLVARIDAKHIIGLSGAPVASANPAAVCDAFSAVLKANPDDPQLAAEATKFVSAYILEYPMTPGSVAFGCPMKPCDRYDVLKTSFPLGLQIPHKKIMASDVKTWKNSLSLGGMPELFEQFTFPALSQAQKVFVDEPLIHAIALFPIIGFTPSLAKLVVPFVFDRTLARAIVAVRSLQALVLHDPSVFTQLVDLVLNIKYTSIEQLFVQIMTVSMMFSAYSETRADLESVLGHLSSIYVCTMCSPIFEVRSMAYTMVKNLPSLPNRIGHDSLLHLASLASNDCNPTTIDILPDHSLQDLSLTNFEVLYNIFLGVAFSSLTHYADNIHMIHDKLVDIATKPTTTEAEQITALNLSVVIFSTATATSPKTEQLQTVLKRCLAIVEERPKLVIMLLSVLTHTPLKRISDLVNVLLVPTPLHTRALMDVFHAHLREINTDEIVELYPIVIKSLSKVFHFFTDKKVTSLDSIEPLWIPALIEAMHVVIPVCHYWFEHNSIAGNGPILRRKRVTKNIAHDNWLLVIFNSTRSSDPALSSVAHDALAAYCAVTTIPDPVFNVIADHIVPLASVNIEAATHLLELSFPLNLCHFIHNVPTQPELFQCIALLFDPIPSIDDAVVRLSARVSRPQTQSELEFTSIFYSRIGSILAVALLLMSGDVTGYENHALVAVKNIALTISLLHPSDEIVSLLSFLKNAPNVLPFNDIKQMSGLMSQCFRFCSEQFLKCAFMCLKQRQCNNFMTVIEPWFTGIKLNFAEPGIIEGCDPEFVSFTAFSFLSEAIQILFAPPLLPSVLDIVTNIERDPANRESSAIFMISSGTDIASASETAALELCKRNPGLVDMFVPLFEFRLWFYHAIQLHKFDGGFLLYRFLDSQEVSYDETPNLTKYDDVMSYALTVALSIIRSNLHLESDPFLPAVLSFSMIAYDPLLSICQDILKELTGTKFPSLKLILSIQTPDQQSLFFRELFTWGTTCGDLAIATRACKVALEAHELAAGTELPIAIRSLKIIGRIMCDNYAVKTSEQKLVNVIQGDTEFNLKQYLNYTCALIELISTLSLKQQTPSSAVLELFIGFAGCGSKEFEPLVSAALGGIFKHLRANVTESSIGGLVASIARNGEVALGRECLAMLQQIAKECIMQSCPTILFEGKNPELACLALLAPSLSSKEIQQYETLLKMPLDYTSIEWSCLQPIVRVFTQLEKTKICTVYPSALAILQAHPSNVAEFDRLAMMCLKDNVSDASNQFINCFQQHGTFSTIKMPPAFFTIPSQLLDYTGKEWTTTDPTLKVIPELPPLYVNDLRFCGTDLVSTIRDKCSAIRVEPFTSYYAVIFSSQLVKIENDIQMPLRRIDISNDDITRFKTIPDQIRHSSSIVNCTSATEPLRSEIPLETLLTVKAEAFLPDDDEVTLAEIEAL